MIKQSIVRTFTKSIRIFTYESHQVFRCSKVHITEIILNLLMTKYQDEKNHLPRIKVQHITTQLAKNEQLPQNRHSKLNEECMKTQRCNRKLQERRHSRENQTIMESVLLFTSNSCQNLEVKIVFKHQYLTILRSSKSKFTYTFYI